RRCVGGAGGQLDEHQRPDDHDRREGRGNDQSQRAREAGGLTPDTRGEPRILTDHSVEAVCEDASDAGGTVSDAGERGTTILARPLALRRTISNLIDNAIKYG